MSAVKVENVEVKVEYALVDGAHFFTSKELKGLCAATNNYQTALEEARAQAKQLLRENRGIWTRDVTLRIVRT